ncbi:glycosyltransferase family protein [Streptomyces violascens]|uniref:hypothetical protein n=1 Tax=Streptomyces violascens TaxID=67381 RepID=UPI0036AE6B26
MRAAILYGFHQSGHVVACERIASALSGVATDPQIVSPLDNDILRESIGKVYRQFAMHSVNAIPATLTDERFRDALYDEVEEAIGSQLAGVDVILSTHAYSTWLSAKHLTVSGNTSCRLIDVQTDYSDWPVYPHDRVDAYVGPELRFRKGLYHNMHEIGIPLPTQHPLSASNGERPQWLQELLSQRPVLIVGGADGFGPVEEAVEALYDQGIPVLVVTGRNKDLYECLAQRLRTRNARERIGILGFVRDLWQLMPKSRAVVTKAGGMTVTDAFFAEVPVICTPPVLAWEAESMAQLDAMGAVHNLWEWDDMNSQRCRDVLKNGEMARSIARKGKELLNNNYADDLREITQNSQTERRSPTLEAARKVMSDVSRKGIRDRLVYTAAGRLLAREMDKYE